LTWTPSGLFACANEFVDKFTAGLSTDQGKTFTPIMHLGGVCPLTCDPSSSVGQQCTSDIWSSTASTIGATCGAGGNDPGTTSAGPSSSSSGASSGGDPPPAKSGCACSVSGDDARGVAMLSLAGLGAALAVSRRRVRRDNRRGARQPKTDRGATPSS